MCVVGSDLLFTAFCYTKLSVVWLSLLPSHSSFLCGCFPSLSLVSLPLPHYPTHTHSNTPSTSFFVNRVPSCKCFKHHWCIDRWEKHSLVPVRGQCFAVGCLLLLLCDVHVDVDVCVDVDVDVCVVYADFVIYVLCVFMRMCCVDIPSHSGTGIFGATDRNGSVVCPGVGYIRPSLVYDQCAHCHAGTDLDWDRISILILPSPFSLSLSLSTQTPPFSWVFCPCFL
jgi:hypothetical protein